jgi:2-succinyl-5-enolpyruvyl-6-hydroxy-3-cyclohexene-1-carboxylate synthase
MAVEASPANPLYAYVGAFVDELARSGVRHAVLCPGSRSAPLALTLAEQPRIALWTQVDERSAAFFALGLAKGLGEPVALICTSGTAAANFMPAVIEAKLTHVPLVVLTADRPPELRDVGAPQTIDQDHLYGRHVKWFAESMLPQASDEALRYARTLACRAVAAARAVPAGPVHVNMPFCEPLVPVLQPLPVESERDPLAWYGRPDNAPFVAVSVASPSQRLEPRALDAIAETFHKKRRGLILAGPQGHVGLPQQLLALARRLHYPILADPLAGLRGAGGEDDLALASYDAFLRDERFVSAAAPEVILRFGAMPISKPLSLYLQRFPACPQIVVAGEGDWPDPTQQASAMLHVDPYLFCRDLTEALKGLGDHEAGATPPPNEWEAQWQSADRAARSAMQATMMAFDELFEGRVFTELAAMLPRRALLFVGNSMPVRDCDTFFWPENKRIFVVGNRGANGIDGVVSTALGLSAAVGRQAPVVLVIGDLSFYHDLNGLLAARLHDLDLIIVLVNNDGGGIFSFLPQADYPEHFERVFGTPTGLNFAPAVQMYGGTFVRAATWEAFRDAVSAGGSQGGLHVIEIRTDRASNVIMHRSLWHAVSEALVERGIVPGEG